MSAEESLSAGDGIEGDVHRERNHGRWGNWAASIKCGGDLRGEKVNLCRLFVGLGEDVFVDETLLRQRAIETEFRTGSGGGALCKSCQRVAPHKRQESFETDVSNRHRRQNRVQKRIVRDDVRVFAEQFGVHERL